MVQCNKKTFFYDLNSSVKCSLAVMEMAKQQQTMSHYRPFPQCTYRKYGTCIEEVGL